MWPGHQVMCETVHTWDWTSPERWSCTILLKDHQHPGPLPLQIQCNCKRNEREYEAKWWFWEEILEWDSTLALQPILHVLWTLAMKFSVRVLKHVIPSHMHSHVLLPQAFIQSLQLLAEVPTKMVKMDGVSCGQTDSENTAFRKTYFLLTSKSRMRM